MEKKNLLLLHGALGSKAQLHSLAAILSSDFNIHMLTFRGHGNVKSEQPFSMDGFADQVLQFLKENNIKKTHIFGYSMGGYVALTLALKHPKWVKSIITLGTKFDWTIESAAQEIRKLNPDLIEEKVPSFASYLNSLHTANFWKDVVSKTSKMMAEMGNGQKLHNKDLQNIMQDVLVCLGDEDNMVSLKESQQAVLHLPNAKYKPIPNCKHPIEKVDVEGLSKIIKMFILGW